MEELHKEKETISGMFDSIAGHYDLTPSDLFSIL